MDAGFTLDPSWLGGETVQEFLAPYIAQGLRVLEFILHPHEEDWTCIKRMAEEWVTAGQRCQIHAPYKNISNPERFASTRRAEVQQLYAPALELAEQLAQAGGFAPALVFHGARGTAPMDELVQDTRELLRWVLSETQRARPVLELLPPKTLNRVGETRDQVLSVVREVNDPRLGLCWDLGHDAILGYPELPSDEFLCAVRHVHLHDVNPAGEDHFPLVHGRVSWQDDLRALQRVGFEGTVTLELSRERTQRAEAWRAQIAASFAAMRTVMP